MLQDKPNSLGKRLRNIRKKYGCESPQQLSELLKGKYCVSGILRRERGEIKITNEYVEDLCKALRVPAYEKQLLLSLVGIYLTQFDPWHTNKKGVKVHQLEYLTRVLSSKVCKQYEPLFICALLQTEDYIYHAFRTHGLDSTAASLNAKIRAKMGQDVLNRDKKSTLKNIIFLQDEEALYRIIGSPKVMIKQLEKLRGDLNNKQIDLRIVPRLSYGNVILGYNLGTYDDILADMETATGLVFATDPDTIEEFEKTLAAIYDISVAGNKADQIIKRAIDTYKKM